MADMDWLDDDTMTPEETMRRFEALRPEPSIGPVRVQAVREWARAHAFSVADIRVVESGTDVKPDEDVRVR